MKPPDAEPRDPRPATRDPRSARIAILTISDSASKGDREDLSGQLVAEWVLAQGWRVAERETVPDEQELIAGLLSVWADEDLADLVLITGGTGLTARDITPEATMSVLDRVAPGIPEAMRAAVAATFPQAALSRAVAGTRGRTLIINLPGSPGGVRDGLAVLAPIAGHAIELLRGTATEHGRP